MALRFHLVRTPGAAAGVTETNLEHDDPIDLVEAGRRLGHDLWALDRLPAHDNWPQPVREGFAGARLQACPRRLPERYTRKFLQLRLGALERGRVVAADVTPAALRQLDLPRCPVTREALSAGTGTATDWSIDRLNNDGGYALANLAVMSVRANRAKASLDFAAVLARAQAPQASDGLTPSAWQRMAVLMLGPAFALRPAEAPDLPLCAPLPTSSLRTATQQVQRLLTLAAGRAADRNRLLRALMPPQSAETAVRQLALLANQLHHALKRLPPQAEPWDAWLAPEAMACLPAWRASLGPALWAEVARRAGLLAGGQAVNARTLAPWQLACRGYLHGHGPGAARTH